MWLIVMRGAVLNVTRSWGRSRSDKRAGLERWAEPMLCGALGPGITSWDMNTMGDLNQKAAWPGDGVGRGKRE